MACGAEDGRGGERATRRGKGQETQGCAGQSKQTQHDQPEQAEQTERAEQADPPIRSSAAAPALAGPASVAKSSSSSDSSSSDSSDSGDTAQPKPGKPHKRSGLGFDDEKYVEHVELIKGPLSDQCRDWASTLGFCNSELFSSFVYFLALLALEQPSWIVPAEAKQLLRSSLGDVSNLHAALMKHAPLIDGKGPPVLDACATSSCHFAATMFNTLFAQACLDEARLAAWLLLVCIYRYIGTATFIEQVLFLHTKVCAVLEQGPPLRLWPGLVCLACTPRYSASRATPQPKHLPRFGLLVPRPWARPCLRTAS